MRVIHSHIDQQGNIIFSDEDRHLLSQHLGAVVEVHISSQSHQEVSSIAATQALDPSVVRSAFEAVSTTPIDDPIRTRLAELRADEGLKK